MPVSDNPKSCRCTIALQVSDQLIVITHKWVYHNSLLKDFIEPTVLPILLVSLYWNISHLSHHLLWQSYNKLDIYHHQLKIPYSMDLNALGHVNLLMELYMRDKSKIMDDLVGAGH